MEPPKLSVGAVAVPMFCWPVSRAYQWVMAKDGSERMDGSPVRMRHRTRREEDHLVYYVFDLLYLDRRDLSTLPLLRRKEILKTLIESTAPPGVQFSDHVEEKGKAFFEVASNRGLEGI